MLNPDPGIRSLLPVALTRPVTGQSTGRLLTVAGVAGWLIGGLFLTGCARPAQNPWGGHAGSNRADTVMGQKSESAPRSASGDWPNTQTRPGSATWSTDYAQAWNEAQSSGRPLMILFTGSDWCSYCQRLEREVLETPEFSEWAGEQYVMFKSDELRRAPQAEDVRRENQALQAKYRVNSFPTIVGVDPQGQEISRMGYQAGGADQWIRTAETKLSGGRDEGTTRWR